MRQVRAAQLRARRAIAPGGMSALEVSFACGRATLADAFCDAAQGGVQGGCLVQQA